MNEADPPAGQPPHDDRTVVIPPPPPPPAAASSAGDSGNALPLGTYLGEFELVSVLGEGGFGIVYQAWDHSLERKVALKEYMPSALAARTGQTQVQVKSERHRDTFEAGRKSFVNEAKLLAQFDHPALVKVYRFWEANGTAYMVMPLYEGITLKDQLRARASPPDEAWLMALLGPLTEALAVIHAERCFHRDIAPDNIILLANSGKPLLLDFGAARRVIGDMTQALTVILKPGYAPVEQYAEAPHMKQGAWTDIYALAASVHFALLGRTPPPSVSRMMGDTYQPLAELLAGRYSDGFLRAIDHALLVKPEERTQSIDELRAGLGLAPALLQASSVATGGHAPAAAAAPVPPAPPKKKADSFGMDPTQMATQMGSGAAAPVAKRGKGPLIALAALALGGAGLGGYLLTRPKPAPPPAPIETAAAPAPTAAPAPAPVPAPAPAPARFDALAEFERVLQGQTLGWGVQAQAAKPQLRIGRDSLSFTVSAARAGYVQVLVLGPDGSLLQFFPNSQAPAQRIEPGQTLKLPQASWPLETVEPAGPEHFLVVVSEQPRDYAVLSTEREYLFLKLPTGPRADALLAQWTAPTPLLLGSAPKACQGPACEAYGAARFTVDVVR